MIANVKEIKTKNKKKTNTYWKSTIETSKKVEVCSKLTIKTPEWRYWRPSGVFIVNFEPVSHLFLVFLLLTLNR